jgi:hypothetical protein
MALRKLAPGPLPIGSIRAALRKADDAALESLHAESQRQTDRSNQVHQAIEAEVERRHDAGKMTCDGDGRAA